MTRLVGEGREWSSKGCRPAGWKAALQRRSWGSCWRQDWMWARDVLAARKDSCNWAALGREFPAGWGRWPFPYTQQWWDTAGVLCPVSCSLWETWAYLSKSTKELQRWLNDWSIFCKRRGIESCSCSDSEEKGLGNLICVYKHLMAGSKEDIFRLFSLVSSERAMLRESIHTPFKGADTHHLRL